MGVPKFFRYISERYPCLSEFVKEYQIPIFDNLYLDMNGIIHMCSHPDDGNPHFRITEEKIFADIFHYIEVLFRMIKPQKVFFMAVDGVAPRAKMNQQRGRRFRSAKDAEKLENEALRKGEKLPDGERFDSNCITPGTEFMARLHEQLKYFVVNKISTDKMWRKCKIILSGHETPGEGEHKIMDYIRYIRSQPGYDPNTRHCLYGLDADLIMLGLCTHEPHFSLLREEVKFGKKAKRSNVPEEIRFYLLHLSLMREYLELEFKPLKDKLQDSEVLTFDIEKIIDDWILMGFLVGNDFIPNLPNLHITNGALPVLYQAYMEVLPTLNGYINEGGILNLERFEKFMKKLAEIDVKNFEEIQDDLNYMKMKTGRKFPAHAPVSSKSNKNEANDEVDHHEEIRPGMDPRLAQLIQETDELDIDSDDDSEKLSSEDEAFKTFKDEYYRNKMEYQKVTPEVMREQAEGYVRAIQWNLHYYYNGVCSWSWFYPHHYSPYISDIKGFSDLKLEFELGTPFKPYQQLLAVLPPASKGLLPKCYHNLMTDEKSVIKEYYPEEFQTDLNGKRQEWEAVVLVPFIDENILLEAMKPLSEQLTSEEAKRNTHGPMLFYNYVEDDLGVYKAPEYFPDVSNNHANCVPIYIDEIRVPEEKLIKGAYPGARFDVFYPGFPTMKHLKYESKLKKARVKVFEMPSRNENMIIRLLPNELYFEDSIPQDLLGRTVWVGWPHLVEAKVVAISNKKQKFVYVNDENKKYIVEEEKLFDSELEGVTQHYRERLGIDFGETKVLVHVKLMIGRKYVFTSNRRVNLQKQFANILSYYPLQSIVHDITVHDECYTTFSDISDVFPVDSLCFTLTNPYYGSQGTIMDSKECLKNNFLKVSLDVTDEPDFSSARYIDEKLKNSYLTLTDSASQLALSNYVFSRITGSLYISTCNGEKSVNVGLDLKFNKKNQETPGFTRKIENVWYYTNKAVALVKEYFEKFPEIFHYLSRNSADDIIADEIFDREESDEKVKSIQHWLKTLPTHNIERRICNSVVLEPEVITEIERIVDQSKASSKKIVMQIKPHHLYKPNIQMGNLTPDPLVKTKIFDRIVNVREGFTVPLGLKGTVIAIHKPANVLNNDSDDLYDVVFDEAFVGGMALNCSNHKGYRVPKTSFINISYGKRLMEQKTGVPGALRALAKERKNTNNFHVNTSNNSNITDRQQNSAFASFSKIPPANIPLNLPLNKSNYYQNEGQSYNNQHIDKNKINKNSFYYMTDFTQKHDTKSFKENTVNLKSNDTHNQNKPLIKGVHSPQKLQHNVRARPDVDTNFLKKMLKIEDGTSSSGKSKLNIRPNNQVTQSRPGTSSIKEQIKSTNASASASLLSYYQSNCLGCPRYTYLENIDGISAQVALPNGKVICGKSAKSREEACENVAQIALSMLANLSKPSRQGPPSNFPVPPVNWVQQQNKMPSQIFVNKSYQKQLSSNQQKTNTPVEYNKRGSGPNFNRNNADVQQNLRDNTNASTSFVPLQALKKRQTSRASHNINKGMMTHDGGSTNTAYEKNNHSSMTNLPKEQNNHRAGERMDRSRRQRKTRIAANFCSNK